jgi:hypothetical protein
MSELLWLLLWPSLVAGAYGLQIYQMTRAPRPKPAIVSATDTHTIRVNEPTYEARGVTSAFIQPQWSEQVSTIGPSGTNSVTKSELRAVQQQQAVISHHEMYQARKVREARQAEWGGWFGVSHQEFATFTDDIQIRLTQKAAELRENYWKQREKAKHG